MNKFQQNINNLQSVIESKLWGPTLDSLSAVRELSFIIGRGALSFYRREKILAPLLAYAKRTAPLGPQ